MGVPIDLNARCKTKSPWTKADTHTGVHYCTAQKLQRF